MYMNKYEYARLYSQHLLRDEGFALSFINQGLQAKTIVHDKNIYTTPLEPHKHLYVGLNRYIPWFWGGLGGFRVLLVVMRLYGQVWIGMPRFTWVSLIYGCSLYIQRSSPAAASASCFRHDMIDCVVRYRPCDLYHQRYELLFDAQLRIYFTSRRRMLL